MASESLSLRVLGPEGPQSLRVHPLSSVAALVSQVLAGREGQLLAGFPPRALRADDQSAVGALLGDCETLRLVLAREPSKGRGRRGPRGDPVAASVARAKRLQAVSAKPSPGVSHRNERAVERSIARAVSGGRRKQRAGVRPAPASEEESALALARAAAGARDSLGRGLRRVYRRALEGQYEEVKAVSRVGAVRTGYSVSALTPPRVRIEFLELDGRRRLTDEVDVHDEATLRAVLRVVLADPAGPGLESLKPINLARASPRVFWSLAIAFGNDLQAGLRRLLPEVGDWSFLNERKRTLSDKARQNLEQQRLRAERAAKRSRKVSSLEEDVPKPPEDVPEQEQHPNPPSETSPRVRELLSTPCEDLVPEEWRQALGFDCRLGPLAQALDSLSTEEEVRVFVDEVSRRHGKAELPAHELDSWVAAAQATVVLDFCLFPKPNFATLKLSV